MSCLVIIPAAGSGSRFGSEIPKQFLPLRGQPVLEHVIGRFEAIAEVGAIVVALAPDRIESMRALALAKHWRRVTFVEGGASRQDSVMNALTNCADQHFELVAVHDAVRPFFRRATFEKLLSRALEAGGAIPVLPLTESIHRVSGGFVVDSPDRSEFAAAQTPQCFRTEILREALDRAQKEGISATDEAGAVRRIGGTVAVVPGDPFNLKITRPEDLNAAERFFDEWSMT